MVVRESPERAVIPQFYAGREVFITGATGFMGKVLVERLLATCPDIGRLHLLVRAKKEIPPETRLTLLKQSPVFDVLRRASPEQLGKLRLVTGDITRPNLGLTDQAIAELEKVSVVFNSAATVKMDEELSVAMEQNVFSVTRLLDICDRLPKLTVWVHVSTAYCHAERGVVEERVYPPPRPLARMLRDANAAGKMTARETKRFIAPKPNTYTFTKMLAENAVVQRPYSGYARAIFRPTILISSMRDPFPGWVEGRNGPSGVAAATARGALRVMCCDGAAQADMLPVDIAVDTLIAAAWETALDQLKVVRVYNCSTMENPTDWETLRRCIVETARDEPSAEAIWYPNLTFARSRLIYKPLEVLLQTLPLHLAEFVCKIFSTNKDSINDDIIVCSDVIGRLQLSRVSGFLRAMNDALEYFATRSFRFPADAVRRLRSRLSPQDAAIYNLDTRSIEWKSTLCRFVGGARRHVLRECDDTLPAARRRLRRLYFLDRGLSILVAVLILWGFLAKGHAFALLRSIPALATWLCSLMRDATRALPH